ncbi:MAG: hypothetical protein JXQ73_23280 [Phycisphaerae bacterium]|nr:hypothetical protein [Phycisphaerae bacterium]
MTSRVFSWGLAATCLGLALTPPIRAQDVCRVDNVVYNGWKCTQLSNGRIDVVVAPELGGRIVQLRLGKAEYLWVNPDLAGKVVRYVTGKAAPKSAEEKKGPTWANYGGDKLWPAPQGTKGPEQWPGPPDPADKGGTVDNGKYELEVLASGPKEAAVRLTSPDDLYAGIRFVREIRIHPRSTTIDLKAKMVNILKRPVRWGIWQVTQHAGHMGVKGGKIQWDPATIDVKAWSPLNPTSAYPAGYQVMFGLKDNPQFQVDKTFAQSTGTRLFRLDYAYQVGKVGMDNVDGWLAVTHQTAGYLYAHTFPSVPTQEYPDGASVEFWASGRGEFKFGDEIVKMTDNEPLLVESEVLSPFARVLPGRWFAYESKMHLSRGTGPIVSVNVGGAELDPVRLSDKTGLAGRLAVFHDGKLQMPGISKRSSEELGQVTAGRIVDLAELASRRKLRWRREIVLVDDEGKTLGAWPVR